MKCESDKDRQHGGGRQGQQYSEETEQLPARDDGENNDDRVQSDAITDKFGRQYRPFD